MGGCHASAASLVADPKGFHNKYELRASIGEGSFGKVFLASSLSSGSSRAVKVIDVRGREGAESPEKVARAARHERQIWARVCRSEHCIELLEHYVEKDCFFFVMERCEASLMDRIDEAQKLGDTDLAGLLHGMLSGIAHIHSLRIVHRDVKPNNFLLGSDFSRSVKLCDFGLAAHLPRGDELLKGCYGTAPYMAPEIVMDLGHTLSADMWSYAVCAYVVVYRSFPYVPRDPSSKAMKFCIMHGVPEPRFLRAGPRPTDALDEFVRSLLVRSPRARCSAKEAFALPFLTGANDTASSAKDMAPCGSIKKTARELTGSTLSATRGFSDASTQLDASPCTSYDSTQRPARRSSSKGSSLATSHVRKVLSNATDSTSQVRKVLSNGSMEMRQEHLRKTFSNVTDVGVMEMLQEDVASVMSSMTPQAL